MWNFSKMWENKQLSLRRQHHCRKCGKAVCDNCSPRTTTYPVMGFEFPVRFCTECFRETTDEE